MASQPGSAPVKMDRYKTKLCLFHLQGRCCKGACLRARCTCAGMRARAHASKQRDRCAHARDVYHVASRCARTLCCVSCPGASPGARHGAMMLHCAVTMLHCAVMMLQRAALRCCDAAMRCHNAALCCHNAVCAVMMLQCAGMRCCGLCGRADTSRQVVCFWSAGLPCTLALA